MEMANALIDKIFDIEKSALKMTLAADNEKKELDRDYNKKKEQFDKELEEEYKLKYQEECKKIDEQIINEKNTYINDMQNEKNKLNEKYLGNKEKMVQAVVKEITGV